VDYSLANCVGKTPLVELKRLCTKPGVRLFAKLEGNNPGGSVKDRPALNMISQAESRGELTKEIKIIEPTSGNTGIALAMIACAKGYQIELVMPASATRERVLTMKAYGAQVTLTPQEKSMEGAIDYAREQVQKQGYLMLDQFSNKDNYLAHYHTTGPEIWQDSQNRVTHFVSAMGTTGTIMGVSKFLKEQNKDIQIIGAQPTPGSSIPGIRRWPKEYLPKIFDPTRVDEIIDVSQKEAESMTRRLAREEGILAGVSSGGALHCALQTCQQIKSGTVVVIICDRGDRYLSTSLFENE